jgi:hypothetical protein
MEQVSLFAKAPEAISISKMYNTELIELKKKT